ncbi:MAG: hypothetical protein PHR16_08990 [Methylovulum sp.]|nr:hypothetical protein [Methylovulum sp.]
MVPDAYIEIRFRTTEENGRKTTVSGDFYACPMFIDGEGFDCRLLIKGMELVLGTWYKVPVKFLNRDLVLPKLSVGKIVTLWEGKDIADGKVLKIT